MKRFFNTENIKNFEYEILENICVEVLINNDHAGKFFSMFSSTVIFITIKCPF